MDHFISLLPFKRLLFGGGERRSGRGGRARGTGEGGKRQARNVASGKSVVAGVVDRMSDQLPFNHPGACHSSAAPFSPVGISRITLCVFFLSKLKGYICSDQILKQREMVGGK